ncbi:hypothetical protein T484DRAFT_1899260, partial [Baffinella frigidus]
MDSDADDDAKLPDAKSAAGGPPSDFLARIFPADIVGETGGDGSSSDNDQSEADDSDQEEDPNRFRRPSMLRKGEDDDDEEEGDEEEDDDEDAGSGAEGSGGVMSPGGCGGVIWEDEDEDELVKTRVTVTIPARGRSWRDGEEDAFADDSFGFSDGEDDDLAGIADSDDTAGGSLGEDDVVRDIVGDDGGPEQAGGGECVAEAGASTADFEASFLFGVAGLVQRTDAPLVGGGGGGGLVPAARLVSCKGMWVPLSVMVAALPAAISAQVPVGERKRSDNFKVKCDTKVAKAERLASKAAAEGHYLQAIDAVEDNVRARARYGTDESSDLISLLEAVVFLCNAFAIECLQRNQLDQADLLLDRAEELTKKSVLKKCRVTEMARAGLRAATFNTAAMMHRKCSSSRQALRAVKSALKVTRRAPGLDVVEAATLLNLSTLLIAEGKAADAITVASSSLQILSNHQPEAERAWEADVALEVAAGQGGKGAGARAGRSGRTARITALLSMVAMGHYNSGVALGKSAGGLSGKAMDHFARAVEVSERYLGRSSAISIRCREAHAAALSLFSGSPSAHKGANSFDHSPMGSGYVHWGHAPTA